MTPTHCGTALSQLKTAIQSNRKLTRIGWSRWCDENGIALASADQAILVAGKLTLEQVEACDGITAAKVRAGVTTVKGETASEDQDQPPAHEEGALLRIMVKVTELLGAAVDMPVVEEDSRKSPPRSRLPASCLNRCG